MTFGVTGRDSRRTGYLTVGGGVGCPPGSVVGDGGGGEAAVARVGRLRLERRRREGDLLNAEVLLFKE